MRLLYTILLMTIYLDASGQISPPAGIGDSENMIMWLSPDTAVFNSSGQPATEGQNIHEWHDISGNGFIFRNTRNSRRPNFTTIGNDNYIDFSSGDFLFNTAIKDSINGLEEFSIFVVIKSDVTNTDKGLLYWKYPPDGEDDGLCLRYDKAGWWTGGSNLIKAGYQGNNGANQIETSSNTQTTNKQVLTLTWKKGGRIYSFIDGVENDSSDAPSNTPLSGIQEILIGKGAKDESNNEGWNGKIGTFIFYNEQFNTDTVEVISNELDVIYSAQSGNWNNPNTWDCNCIPNSVNNIKILSGHTITLTNDEEINHFTLANGGSFVMQTQELNVYGNLTNNGIFIGENGKINFLGSKLQKFTSTYTSYFGDIEVNNPAGLKLNIGKIPILGTVSILSGNLNANGNLQLISTDSSTARIARIPSGASISGEITVQRYIYNSGRFYRYLSSPVTNATVADWQNEIPITGQFENPSQGPSYNSSNPSLFYYDETASGDKNSGWVNYPSSVNSNIAPLVPGKGYGIYVRNNVDRPEYVDVTGIPNTGTFNIDLDYTNTGNILADGWNLVGNPYPSQIDWQSVSILRKLGIDNAIYYTDNTLGAPIFRSFVNGISVPFGGNGVIGSSQAFWVHANGINPSIQLLETDKTLDDYSFYKQSKPSNLMRISIIDSINSQSDETAIYLSELATDTFDSKYDALKFGEYDISISTEIINGQKLSINSLNINPEEEKAIQIILGDVSAGEHTLKLTGINSFEPEYNIVLIDHYTSSEMPIYDDASIKFIANTDEDSYNKRFSLKLMNNSIVLPVEEDYMGKVNVFPNPNSGDFLNVEIVDIKNKEYSMTISDQMGHFKSNLNLQDFEQTANKLVQKLNISDYPAGVYYINLITENGSKTTKVIIN